MIDDRRVQWTVGCAGEKATKKGNTKAGKRGGECCYAWGAVSRPHPPQTRQTYNAERQSLGGSKTLREEGGRAEGKAWGRASHGCLFRLYGGVQWSAVGT